MAFPDFYCVGGQKCGTGWLYRNLPLCSGQVWLPPVKELHYFDRIGLPEDVEEEQRERKRRRSWRREIAARQRQLRIVGSALKRFPSLSTAAWLARYHLGTPTDAWYESLFRPAPGQKAGDITPAYSMLEEKAVRHVHRLNESARVIFVVRNPVERAWSSIKMTCRRTERMQELTERPGDLVQEFLRSPGFTARSNYLRTIEVWQHVFGPEAFRVWLFDDLASTPDRFVSEVLDHIGAAADRMDASTLSGKANADPAEIKIPTAVHEALLKHYHQDIIGIQAAVGRPLHAWLS